MPRYIDVDALKRFIRENGYVYANTLDSLATADVEKVVHCEDCELHDHCYAEDAFKFSRLVESRRFCGIGKLKESPTN